MFLEGLRTTAKASVRIAGVVVEIRTEYLPNASIDTDLFGDCSEDRVAQVQVLVCLATGP
jgi:hypothetical protein